METRAVIIYIFYLILKFTKRPKTQIFYFFEFSAEDITSDYGFLLWLVNILAVGIEESLSKTIEGKWCQDLQKPGGIILHFVLTNQIVWILAHLTEEF